MGACGRSRCPATAHRISSVSSILRGAAFPACIIWSYHPISFKVRFLRLCALTLNAVSLSLEGNPDFLMWPLDWWLFETAVVSTNPGSQYSCTVLNTERVRFFTITVDAKSRLFQGCSCVNGTFGRPPLCNAVP